MTTIQIADETWLKLTKRKKVGESFDDLINRIMLETPEEKNNNGTREN